MSDFFRINLPYGIRIKKDGQIAAFNREYKPLGGSFSDDSNSKLLYEKYREITPEKINELAFDANSISVDTKDDSTTILFYNDSSNPQHKPEYWEQYLNRLKILSTFIHSSQY